MIVIANANILNEAGELQLADLWIEDGQITKIVPAGSEPAGTAEVCDVEGKFVSAGFIDMHVHLREPGFEHKETIATGTVLLPKADLRLLPACRIPARCWALRRRFALSMTKRRRKAS